MPDQGIHRIFIFGVHRQVRGLVVTHQETLVFEKAAHAAGDGVGELRFSAPGVPDHPKRWIRVTAPVLAVACVNPALWIRCARMISP